MASPIRALSEVAYSTEKTIPVEFTFPDALHVNLILGMFERSGIRVALMKVVDADEQLLIRFDPDGTAQLNIERWESIKDGRMYFYFDDYELAGLITKTIRTKFLFLKQVVYQAYMATPATPILIGTPSTDLLGAVQWLEMRYRKCCEVFPSLGITLK